METVERERFVPLPLVHRAYEDVALPIGLGQTISQPYVVAAMCSLLALPDGAVVLEIGTGSGYAAAVLSRLAGFVVSIERIPELSRLAGRALAECGYANVELRVGDGTLGAPDRAPFDGVVVAAAAPSVPAALVEQLAPGGRIVVPVGTRAAQTLVCAVKTARGLAQSETFPCRFVPLIGEGGWSAETPLAERGDRSLGSEG